MLRIGDFAQAAGTSLATLRLYERQDLLKPSWVDPGSGYRYYEPHQLAQLHRIGTLKELGFSLKEIGDLLKSGSDPAQMPDLLLAKKAEAERDLQEKRQRIKRVELQLQLIKGLLSMTTQDVTRITVPAFQAASIHLELPTNDQAGPALGQAYDEIFGLLHQQGITPSGACMAIWSSTPDMYTDEVVDALVPIQSPLQEEGRVRQVTIASQDLVTITHRGPFSEFQACHVLLKEWLSENQCRLSGPYREIYHTPPGEDSVTEVQYPVEQVLPAGA